MLVVEKIEKIMFHSDAYLSSELYNFMWGEGGFVSFFQLDESITNFSMIRKFIKILIENS